MIETIAKQFIISFGFMFFYGVKKGWYPDTLNYLVTRLVNKLPDRKLGLIWTRSGDQSLINLMKKNKIKTFTDPTNPDYAFYKEHDSLREWLKFLTRCPYCYSFWISLAVAHSSWLDVFCALTVAAVNYIIYTLLDRNGVV